MGMGTDEMVAALFDLSTLDTIERRFVNRMINRVGGYTAKEESDIRRLYKLKLGYLRSIRGRRIDEA